MEFSHLKQVVDHTRYTDNPKKWRGFHPARTVSRFAPVESIGEAIDLFVEEIANDTEADEGDWRREANSALVRLSRDFRSLGRDISPEVARMRETLLWSGREDLPRIAQELISTIERYRVP